jgi:ATP adenylyltransferase
MADFNKNLWAPWRMEYIRSLADEAKEKGCFLCRYLAVPTDDPKNHVVWRGRRALVVMNRFPYTGGHLMVAPHSHTGDLLALDPDESAELTSMTWQSVALLRRVLAPQGFNVGTNLGLCAGAGLADHLHTHVVPRWSGDTNYMAVLGDVRVVPDSLDALYKELIDAAVEMGLRDRPTGDGP